MTAPIPGFQQEADAIVACACGAKEGQPCKPSAKDRGKPWAVGQVHFSRRMRRYLLTGKATAAERDAFEKKAVEMLRQELKKRVS